MTPATVIGVLTILGFSLYDTVVVFDKVKENTRGITSGNRVTYSEAANLALNQTLVRSINTSVVALLPVAAILIVGVGLLGAGTLKDLALALFIGTAAGTYSSIFIATPVACQLQERRPEMKALAARVAAPARRARASRQAPTRVRRLRHRDGRARRTTEVDAEAPRPWPSRRQAPYVVSDRAAPAAQEEQPRAASARSSDARARGAARQRIRRSPTGRCPA